MSSLTEFHLFPDLPTELRLKIYGIALSVPRVVNITCDKGVFQRGVPRTAKAFIPRDKPPAFLHVCHESRQEALSVYMPSFKTDASPRYTYVSFSQDTIRVSDGALSFVRDAELKTIQKMIVDVKDTAYFAHFNINTLKKMQSNLKEIELVAEQGEAYSWNRGRRLLMTLSGDIKMAMEMDPEWNCLPHVNIVDARTAELVDSIEGMKLGTEE